MTDNLLYSRTQISLLLYDTWHLQHLNKQSNRGDQLAALLSEKRVGEREGGIKRGGREGWGGKGEGERRRETERQRFFQGDLCTNAPWYSGCICSYNRYDL